MADDESKNDRHDETTVHQPIEEISSSSPSPAAEETEELPRSIGAFRIIRKLGRGGMGVVYEAEQSEPRRRVAIKVVRGGSFADEATLRMFQREADSLARLKHPGIADIYQVGRTENGQPFFVMELVDGRPLDEYVASRPELTGQAELAHRLQLFRHICDAVQYAHQRGIIHRDLKPSNILVVEPAADETSASGTARHPSPKVLDFGLARVTDAEATMVTEVGMIKGTLPYMSPEQARGRPEEIDTRADVYALGVMLYEILAGSRPYDVAQSALAEAIRVICESEPRPMSGSWSGSWRPDPDIETIVGKALEKEPERRYGSASALSEDLERYLASQPILARPPSAAYQIRKMVRRHRGMFAVGAASLVLLVLATVVSSVMYVRAGRAAERARVEAQRSDEVARFMTEMLESAGPAVARGRDATLLREILDETSTRVEDELSDLPEVAATLLSRIGTTYFELGEYEPAERVLRQALELCRASFGADDPKTLTAINDLAVLLVSTDDLDEARGLFEEALDGRRRVLEPDDPDIAVTLTQLANLLVNRSQYDEAERLYKEAVEVLRAAYPDGDPTLAIALNGLGNAYHYQARYDDAEASYREALEMHTRLLGEDHPDVLVDRHNLAALFRNRGDRQAAEQEYLGIVELQRRILGEDHPALANTLRELGSVRQSMGDFAGAEGYYRQSLEITARAQGEESEDYARGLNSLALMLNLKGDRERAEELFRRALAIQRRVLGDDNTTVATTRGNLASLLSSDKRYDEAAVELNEALRVMREVVGDDHPDTLVLLNDFGLLKRRTGELDAAETTLREVLDKRRRVLGAESSYVGRTQYDLADLLLDRGDVAGAEGLFRESMATYEAAIGPDYPAIPIIKGRLGMLAMDRGEYAEAESLILEAQRGMVAAFGEDSPRAARAAAKLAELYEAWERAEPGGDKADKAAEWRRRAGDSE